jgi:para-nitrobenzyl esterase
MSQMNRRTFGAVTASAAASTLIAADAGAAKQSAVVETNAGKIRGLVINKVNAFQGIPYGASTAGAGRFQPPTKPAAWTGIKETNAWGDIAPQGPPTEIPEVAATIPKTGVSEDCLRLNVWTKSTSGKRPVMLWLHGGGMFSGSGSYSIYGGANLAREEDVVTVTVNHRLNAFGYLYLAGIGGSEFANAANVGHLDIILALEWVRDNIAKFGGDPGNVTIFGQSGGGAKVATLLAMPGAKGLFHKAIMQSGATVRATTADQASQNAQAFLAKLNVKTAAELQKLPMDALIKVVSAPAPQGGFPAGPVLDGKTLTAHPFDPSGPAISADIPLLIGTTEYEITFFPNTKYDPLDDKALAAATKAALRTNDEDAAKVIAAYKKGRPNASNLDINLILASDGFRGQVLTAAERKAAQPAPVYMYYFTWPSPVSGGKLKSFHTLEIPFALGNVDESKSMTGEGKDRYPLQDKMMTAWANFARNGNPNHKGLPNWPKFDANTRATMILDNNCQVVNDPHGDERRVLAGVRRA